MQKTSIIILTYNQLTYTKECINSIKQYTRPDYEIIVVDNASTDGTVEWLKKQVDTTAIFNDENKGFAGGCNQGILKSCGDVLVLLNNDTIVTPRWLDNMLVCLNSSDKIGAVGVYSNTAGANQNILTNYNYYNLHEIISFAENFNISNRKRWEERIRLCGFCFAVKKTVVNEVGLLDEQFFPGYYEDDDYCFRIRQSGYKLMLCGDTFIHHHGNISFKKDADHSKVITSEFLENRKRFVEKWGFNPSYHGFIRFDVINLMNQKERLRNIRVLEIGCACGATLLKIKHVFPHAQVFGIEINQYAANTARDFADIIVGDIEKIDMDGNYPYNYFDYILIPGVLEHLVDPWKIITKIKKYLKPDGHVIANIPNVMHFSIIYQLLFGMWNYDNETILDKTHLRFFTLKTIREMFEKSGYLINQAETITTPVEGANNFLDYLHMAVPPEKRNELLVNQYIIKAKK